MSDNKNSTISILIVEDDFLQSQVIRLLLGDKGYNTDTAFNGESAILKIKFNSPDIVLLDMNLPDRNGLGVLEEIKDLIESDGTKIVVFSSADEENLVISALSNGATDYVFKKDSERMLLVRIENIVKNIQLNRILKENLRAMKANIDFAVEIQNTTLPQSPIPPNDPVDFYVTYKPIEFVSGDIYDIFKIDEHRYRIFLADAAGHGIQAGFITISIKTEYDRLKMIYDDPGNIIPELSKSNFATFSGDSQYTCIILDLDLNQNTITYTSSGHSTQLLFQNGECQELPATNPMIGVAKDIQPVSRAIELQKDFHLFLFTDGIYEFFDSRGNIFSEEKFYNLTSEFLSHTHTSKESKNFPKSIQDFHDSLYQSLNRESGKIGFRDDITLLSFFSK